MQANNITGATIYEAKFPGANCSGGPEVEPGFVAPANRFCRQVKNKVFRTADRYLALLLSVEWAALVVVALFDRGGEGSTEAGWFAGPLSWLILLGGALSLAPAALACIRACYECVATCTACADACLAEDDVAHLVTCVRLNLDCADVCETTGRLIARPSARDADTLRIQLEACAAACRVCGEECARHGGEGMEHCRVCAEACRACAEACETMASALVA